MPLKIVVEVLDDHSLRFQIEVDQDVAAENNIHAFHENHSSRIEQVQATEGDQRLYLGLHLQALVDAGKIFLPKIRVEVTRAVLAVQSSAGVFQRKLIQVGGLNIELKILERSLLFLQQHHR